MLNKLMRYRASGRRLTVAGASLVLLAACANSSIEASSTPASSTEVSVRQEQQQPSFAEWRARFREEALAAGIRPAVFDNAFKDIEPDSAIVRADQSQPEFTRPVWQYLDGAVSPQRLAQGRRALSQYADTLDTIEQRYGVSRHVLVAIWGLESNFGNNIGDKSVIRSLATLAHEGRRPTFAHTQLIEALKILQQGDVPPSRLLGSWAGAMGQTQFIPSTFNSYAVDLDGDGRRDIWQSPGDALGSAANYLSHSNWQQGLPWGTEVKLPRDFDFALADMAIRKPVSEWLSLGVEAGTDPAIPSRLRDKEASLLLPAGYRGPAFLVTGNFRSILRYNNSTSYALAIGLMSDRLQNRDDIQASWPRDDRPLSRSERIELQERLDAGGFDPGSADGIIGANTRQAIRRLQNSLGMPADGYATHALLERLREH
ncbi:lytic murein transglycosylase [Pseudomonas sp. gcc21]|uniref:lytic murein transglycosylase n=1 Tax=Pseudomonas sp. gcc21 TaxID=2726989 RepID=UPI00145267BD|nr:lytic murein transglycosylase [Pseudomonas sp. gcc21]QJD58932.1 lytic murein transglycosylase [Pseudomonas sp. gcc21]